MEWGFGCYCKYKREEFGYWKLGPVMRKKETVSLVSDGAEDHSLVFGDGFGVPSGSLHCRKWQSLHIRNSLSGRLLRCDFPHSPQQWNSLTCFCPQILQVLSFSQKPYIIYIQLPHWWGQKKSRWLSFSARLQSKRSDVSGMNTHWPKTYWQCRKIRPKILICILLGRKMR